MTDRINYLTVALERDTRDDDAAELIKAIAMLRGVLKVEANVTSSDQWVAESRAKHELSEKLWAVLKP